MWSWQALTLLTAAALAAGLTAWAVWEIRRETSPEWTLPADQDVTMLIRILRKAHRREPKARGKHRS